jgi:hypothetical protein
MYYNYTKMTFQEWLTEKYASWERTQTGRQSYYNFARYLDVNHTALTQWTSGISQPGGDDLAKLASKLGSEIYTLLGVIPPSGQLQALVGSFDYLPAALRERLVKATVETGQQVAARRLSPESAEAKLLAVKVFEKWGFKISG